MTTLAAMGDSFSCGAGVGVQIPLQQTFASVMAERLGLQLRCLAAPGKRVVDVHRDQLPQASRAAVATVLVGLNDIARPGFDSLAVHRDFLAVVRGLRRRADHVIVCRLHDATTLLWLPAPARRFGQARLAAVNDTVDRCGELSRVHVLDLAGIAALQVRSGWTVDRIHPSAAGHQAIATAGLALLDNRCNDIGDPIAGDRNSNLAHVRWLARHGAPYLAGHALTRALPTRTPLHRAG